MVDSRIKLYNDVQNMTLQDVIDYQNKWIKGRTYTYCILGDKKELDINAFEKVRSVIELKKERYLRILIYLSSKTGKGCIVM